MTIPASLAESAASSPQIAETFFSVIHSTSDVRYVHRERMGIVPRGFSPDRTIRSPKEHDSRSSKPTAWFRNYP